MTEAHRGVVAAIGTRRYVVLAIALGAALLLGGEARIASTSYRLIAETGGALVWGCGFLAVGVVLAVARQSPHATKWGLLLAACGYMVFAVAFAVAAYRFDNANLTAPVVYSWLAWLHVWAALEARDTCR